MRRVVERGRGTRAFSASAAGLCDGPVRECERHFPGWYGAATTGRHVGSEPWLERDRLLKEFHGLGSMTADLSRLD